MLIKVLLWQNAVARVIPLCIANRAESCNEVRKKVRPRFAGLEKKCCCAICTAAFLGLGFGLD